VGKALAVQVRVRGGECGCRFGCRTTGFAGRPEVLIDTAKVVMVHQGSGLDDPGIRAFGLRIAPFLRAIDPAFLLSLADEHHAFWLVELLALLLGKVVLALTLLEKNQRVTRNAVVLLSLANRSMEPILRGKADVS
jgi:hypothetical protein